MSSIVRQKVGGNTYLYESVSYRDEQGKPQNHRVSIGKIDKKTGLPVYKSEYIDRMDAAGTPVESADITPVFSVEDVRHSRVLQTGLVHLLGGVARNIGLAGVLEETLPFLHEQVFAIASFLLACGEPVSYCAEWMERSDIGDIGPISSQRISELLQALDEDDRQRFFTAWSRYRGDREYLALDITSISSWSELIDDVEWGYNRDGDTLAQINLCMLMGRQSRLPVRATVYNGSIRDVSTLETTVSQIAPEEYDQIHLVMDKGFSSKKNIDMLLRRRLQFLLALPLTLSFTKKQIDSERKDIDQFANTIVTGAETLRGVTKTRSWSTDHELYVHVYYNDVRATATKNHLYGRVRQLVEEAQNNPRNRKLKEQFDRYLIIRKSEKQDSGYTINVREDVLAEELAHAGWLVLVSNHISDAAEAIRIYRDKDVVEKGFHRIKHSLGLDRLRVHGRAMSEANDQARMHGRAMSGANDQARMHGRAMSEANDQARVHSQQAMESKVFIGFIALILSSHIHRVMLEQKLYKTMTMKELIRTMEKLRTQVIDGRRILFPGTKRQREIYQAFGVAPPV